MKLSIKDSGDNTTILDINGSHVELVNIIVSHMFDNPKFASIILDSNDFYYKSRQITNKKDIL